MSQIQMTLEEFSKAMGSTAPSPGGGGAAAYCGALSAALGSMVCELSADKRACYDYADELRATIKSADELRGKLLALVDGDDEGFRPLNDAWAMPVDTTKEREERTALIQKGLVTACEAPFEMMRLSAQCIEMFKRLAKIANRTVMSDVGVGAMMASAAIKAASVNIYINISMLHDEEKAAELREKVDQLYEEYKKGDKVFKKVLDSLKKA